MNALLVDTHVILESQTVLTLWGLSSVSARMGTRALHNTRVRVS